MIILSRIQSTFSCTIDPWSADVIRRMRILGCACRSIIATSTKKIYEKIFPIIIFHLHNDMLPVSFTS